MQLHIFLPLEHASSMAQYLKCIYRRSIAHSDRDEKYAANYYSSSLKIHGGSGFGQLNRMPFNKKKLLVRVNVNCITGMPKYFWEIFIAIRPLFALRFPILLS